MKEARLCNIADSMGRGAVRAGEFLARAWDAATFYDPASKNIETGSDYRMDTRLSMMNGFTGAFLGAMAGVEAITVLALTTPMVSQYAASVSMGPELLPPVSALVGAWAGASGINLYKSSLYQKQQDQKLDIGVAGSRAAPNIRLP